MPPELLYWAERGGYVLALLFILWLNQKGVWVWGWLYEKERKEKERWRELALRSTDLGERAILEVVGSAAKDDGI